MRVTYITAPMLVLAAACPALAQQLIRLDDSLEGAIGDELATAYTNLVSSNPVGQAVVAHADANGDLELIRYETTNIADNEIVPVFSDEQNGAIGDVAATTLSDEIMVTAVKTGSEKLKVIGWLQGEIRLGDNEESGYPSIPIKEVAIDRVTDELFVTAAIHGGDDDLCVILWQTNPQADPIVERDMLCFGDASAVDVAALSPSRVIVSMRDGSGNLRLRVFDITSNKQLVERGAWVSGKVTETKIRKLSATACVSNVVCGISVVQALTAVRRHPDQRLVLSRWAISEAGDISWLTNDEQQAGNPDYVGVSHLSMTKNNAILTAMRDGDGKLRVVAWHTTNQSLNALTWKVLQLTDNFETAEGSTGKIRDTADTGIVWMTSYPDRFLTAVRTEAGALKAILWRWYLGE